MSALPRSIAVFGYGTVGKPLVNDLRARGAQVLVLSRDPSKLDLPPSVASAGISYADETGIAEALKAHSIDIVVSTIITYGEEQLAIARAAKSAGTVKLFVLSEFGLVTAGHKEGVFGVKERTANTVARDIGIPTVRIYTGLFIEFLPWFNSVPKHPGKFAIGCKGETKITWTALTDITGYTAYILTQLPYGAIGNTDLRLEGQAASFREAAEITGKEVAFVPNEDMNSENGVRQAVHAISDKGWTRTGFDLREPDATQEEIENKSGSGNALWEGHVWKTIKDVWPNSF